MGMLLELDKSIIIATPKNYTTTEQGNFFEKICAEILKKQSYKINSLNVRKTGMEIDIEATHTPSGKSLYVECKFYNDKSTLESKIVDLCFSQSFRAGHDRIALFSTVKLGKDAQGAYQRFRDMKVDFSFYDANEILSALEASGTIQSIKNLELPPSVSMATLLIHPEIAPHWLFQEVEDGVPKSIIIYSYDAPASPEKIKKILQEQNKFEGLELKLLPNYKSKPSKSGVLDSFAHPPVREVVSSIVVADDIMDYKPCRPQDFVGRSEIQKEVWSFLEAVRDNKSSSRLITITGISGSGKSSLVANLAYRFTNIKWRNKFYLYPVDVRSARGARFVAEAVAKAFNSAANDDFISLPHPFTVDNIDEITSGVDFKNCIQDLKSSGKILIVFFDQFEEVIVKEELFPLFRAFKRFGLDVSAESSNFVVGFSWRNGIFLGDNNPAYGLWNELRDYRVEKKLPLFDEKDSRQMISSFEKSEKINLTKALKERLVQQAQGYPWLLKKLCIHLFINIKKGISQEELLVTQMQIKKLFDEDLDRPSREVDCLRYVAKNSPVDRNKTEEEFGGSIVSSLVSNRLIVKTGEKLSVYWDVFRDYLRTSETPIIPWTFLPNSNIGMAIKLTEKINTHKRISFDDLVSISGYSKGTIYNLMVDLQSFSLIKRDNQGYIIPTCIPDEIASNIRGQLLGHIAYTSFLEHYKLADSRSLAYEEVFPIISKIYKGTKEKVLQQYLKRILSWLRYAGLISVVDRRITVYSSDFYSDEFAINTASRSKRQVFLAASSYENSIKLINRLKNEGAIKCNEAGLRNVIADLIALKICIRLEDKIMLINSEELINNPTTRYLALQVSKARTIIEFNSLKNEYEEDLESICARMARFLEKSWKPSSGKRYMGALQRFNDFAQKELKSI